MSCGSTIERKLLTFVLGFLVPQQNPLGRFQPRYDLRNIMHFVERLNMFLAAEVARRENVYFVDTDQVAGGIGKKSCQDDMVWSFTHGTTLSDGDHDHDLNRIEPPTSMQHHYSARWLEFFEAVLHEALRHVPHPAASRTRSSWSPWTWTTRSGAAWRRKEPWASSKAGRWA